MKKHSSVAERGIKQKDFISKMQTMGCDINPTSYSKLEGQVRSATDREIYVIARLLGVPMEALFKQNREFPVFRSKNPHIFREFA